MKTSKIIALILSAALLLGTLTSCDAPDAGETTTESTSASETTESLQTTETTQASPTASTAPIATTSPSGQQTKAPTVEDFLELLSVAKSKLRLSEQSHLTFQTIETIDLNGSVMVMRYDTVYRTDLRDPAAPLMSYITTVYTPDPSAEIVYYYANGYFYTSLSGDRFKEQMAVENFVPMLDEDPIIFLTRYSAESQIFRKITEHSDGSLTAEIELNTDLYCQPLLELIALLSEEVFERTSLSDFAPTMLTVHVSADGVLTDYNLELQFTETSLGGVRTNYSFVISAEEKIPDGESFIPNRNELNTFEDVTGGKKPTPNKPVAPQ